MKQARVINPYFTNKNINVLRVNKICLRGCNLFARKEGFKLMLSTELRLLATTLFLLRKKVYYLVCPL